VCGFGVLEHRPPESSACGFKRYDYRVPVVDDSPILPPDPPGLVLLHDREYRVRSYLMEVEGGRHLLLRGAVRDQKPAGLYLAEDPDPLTIHHMQVEMEVAFPSMEIVAANVLFESHPHTECLSIVDHYGKLVGLSIARGFNNRVRELFGGPRGCTHTTALLLAMAPVAIQSIWSMSMHDGMRDGLAEPDGAWTVSAEQREMMLRPNLNSCHVWDEEGPIVAGIRAGQAIGEPITITERRERLRPRRSDTGPGRD
jgi:hypothetical protein